jgi:hypothetical protein
MSFVADALDVVAADVVAAGAGAVADVADVAVAVAVADGGAPRDPGVAGRRSGTDCSGAGADGVGGDEAGAGAGVAVGGDAVDVSEAYTVVDSHSQDAWAGLSRGGGSGRVGAGELLAGLGGRRRVVVVAGQTNMTRIGVDTEAGIGLRHRMGEERDRRDVHGLDGHHERWP